MSRAKWWVDHVRDKSPSKLDAGTRDSDGKKWAKDRIARGGLHGKRADTHPRCDCKPGGVCAFCKAGSPASSAAAMRAKH